MEQIGQTLKEWWFLIAAIVAFGAGYIELRVRVGVLEKGQTTIKQDMKEEHVEIEKRLGTRIDKGLEKVSGDVSKMSSSVDMILQHLLSDKK